jgi:hypothetical protein
MIEKGKMSQLIKKQTITYSSLEDTSVQPIEKEILKSAEFDKGIHFFSGRCVVRAANRLELRQRAYEYIYDIYSKKGYAKTDQNGLWLTIYDALPDTTTFIAENGGGKIEGALTVVFDSPIGLPADDLYKKEVDVLRNSGRKISEIISLGINRTARDSAKILAGLYYCAYLLAWRIRMSTDFVITINPRHEKFYVRKLLFRKIGCERNFSKVNGALAVLLNLRLGIPEALSEEQKEPTIYKLRFAETEEIRKAKKINEMLIPISDEEFYTFFIDKTDVFENATPDQKEYLNKLSDIHETDHFSISRALAKGISKKLSVTEKAQKDDETKMIKG